MHSNVRVKMAIVVKPTGALRICINSRDLNKALAREQHTLPTLNSMLHKVQGAEVFSKADLCYGYWHVHLDEDSSILAAMTTPYQPTSGAAYHLVWVSHQEIFQKCMPAALEDLPSIHVIADDVLICGNSKTRADAMKNHDETMDALLNCCLDMNIVLNPDKFVYKTQKIPFTGHILTDQGILPDLKKYRPLWTCPTQAESVSAVGHLNGCINYLSRYIPHLANLTKPLQDLTHKHVTFKWEAHHTEAVDKIKKALVSVPALAYFDTNSPVTICI